MRRASSGVVRALYYLVVVDDNDLIIKGHKLKGILKYISQNDNNEIIMSRAQHLHYKVTTRRMVLCQCAVHAGDRDTTRSRRAGTSRSESAPDIPAKGLLAPRANHH